jgi:hypothetical protein
MFMINGCGEELGYGRTTDLKSEATFSPDACSSHQSIQAMTTLSWDDSLKSEPDIFGTIHQGKNSLVQRGWRCI